MSFLRKIIRIPLFLLWFIGVTLYCRIFNRGKNAQALALNSTLVWGKVTAWILNLKVTVSGKFDDFSGGLIVANHQSSVDTLVLASTFKIRFAPKKEMRSWPLIGALTQCNMPVWIDRSTPAKAKVSADAMSETMKNGYGMMVFPEGTTSDGKEGLLPFKSTSFQAVIDSGKSVLPVIIVYSKSSLADLQWFGHRSFLPHAWHVLGLKKIEATVHILDPISPAENEDRKALTARVYTVMNEKWRSL